MGDDLSLSRAQSHVSITQAAVTYIDSSHKLRIIRLHE